MFQAFKLKDTISQMTDKTKKIYSKTSYSKSSWDWGKSGF